MNQETINQIANLSMLDISNQQEQTKQALESIFSLINQLKNVDTTSIEPLSFPLDILNIHSQPLRQDEAKTYNVYEESMKQNAPSQQEQFYLVPKVID